MKLMYEEKMYDYRDKTEAQAHIEKMKAKGWQVKDQYEQKFWVKYTWTVEYQR